MKKKTLTIVAVGILCLTLGALAIIYQTKLMSWTEYFTTPDRNVRWLWREEGDLKRNLAFIRGEELDDLTAYDLNSFKMLFQRRNRAYHFWGSGISSLQFWLDGYHRQLPIEHVKWINDDKICVVYKLKDENENEFYAYVIFVREVENYTKSENSMELDGEYETWRVSGEAYFVSEFLSYEDYKDVKVGDTVSKICEFDPAVVFEEKICEEKIYRLLKDGVLIIETSQDNSIAFQEREIVSIRFYTFDGDECPFNVSLSDLPKLIEEYA